MVEAISAKANQKVNQKPADLKKKNHVLNLIPCGALALN